MDIYKYKLTRTCLLSLSCFYEELIKKLFQQQQQQQQPQQKNNKKLNLFYNPCLHSYDDLNCTVEVQTHLWPFSNVMNFVDLVQSF